MTGSRYLVRDNCVICRLPLLYLDHTFEMKESTPRTCSACLWCAPSKRQRKEILAKLGCWYSCGSDSLPTESKKAEVCQVNPLYALLWGPHSSVARLRQQKGNCIFRSGPRFVAFHLMCNHKQCMSTCLGWLSGSFGVGLYLSVPACTPHCNRPGSLYLPWQRGLFVLDDPSGRCWWWCGALKVVCCYRPKRCGSVRVKRCSVQGKGE